MTSIIKAIRSATGAAARTPPKGVFITLPSGAGELTGVTIVKAGVVVRVENWVVDTTTGEWEAVAHRYLQTKDGCQGETVVRGTSAEEILRSVATGLAMGVFDG